ncbi:major facilitator transporter, partial [Intrasporangium oryzae NRRL B-24470]
GERTAPVHPGEQPTRQGGARGVGRTLGHGIGRAATGAVRVTAATGRYATDRFRTYTHSGGAGETGLSRLTELHATHTAGDAAMAIALAGTLFFNPQTAQARSQVAWFLLLTMVPFVLVAPLVGPLLDRFSHGRRWAIGTTLALRGFLCWVLADLLASDSGWLFPTALLFLVASKAYTIARAAAVPRLLPQGTTLVRANSMMSIAGVVGALLGGVVGGVGLKFGAPWALRGAFVVFVIGTVQAIRLDPRVDSTEGEARLGDTAPIPVERARRHTSHRRTKGVPAEGAALQVDSAGFVARFRRRRQAIPWPVMHAMWSTGGTRVLTGFLLLYLAFLARERPVDGVRGEVVLGLIAVAVGVGNVLGSLLGNRLSDRAPERIAMLSVLASTLACVATGLWYGIWTLVVLGLVQGLGAQVSRLCFDALVQREVPENVRASVFAWAETLLQVLWVAGGALGIMLPLNPRVGFLVCAAALVLTIIMAARQRRVSGPPLGGSGMPGTVR